ncbi:SH3 domain-containing protein [Bacteroidota bacterium]
METLVPLIIIVIIAGAILGGKTFGGTIRKGCGFLVVLVLLIIAIVYVLYALPKLKEDFSNQKENSTVQESGYFFVNQDCQTYTKPDIKSDTLGSLKTGTELFVKNINQFNYFYKVTNEDGKKVYVRKESLTKK